VATLRHLQREQQQQRAQLNETRVTPRPLVLLTDMHAGHFAASSASTRLHDRAVKIAWLLTNLAAGTGENGTAAGGASCDDGHGGGSSP
jgi:hypothetical protein